MNVTTANEQKAEKQYTSYMRTLLYDDNGRIRTCAGRTWLSRPPPSLGHVAFMSCTGTNSYHILRDVEKIKTDTNSYHILRDIAFSPTGRAYYDERSTTCRIRTDWVILLSRSTVFPTRIHSALTTESAALMSKEFVLVGECRQEYKKRQQNCCTTNSPDKHTYTKKLLSLLITTSDNTTEFTLYRASSLSKRPLPARHTTESQFRDVQLYELHKNHRRGSNPRPHGEPCALPTELQRLNGSCSSG
eukprot:284819200_4